MHVMLFLVYVRYPRTLSAYIHKYANKKIICIANNNINQLKYKKCPYFYVTMIFFFFASCILMYSAVLLYYMLCIIVTVAQLLLNNVKLAMLNAYNTHALYY